MQDTNYFSLKQAGSWAFKKKKIEKKQIVYKILLLLLFIFLQC